MTYSEALSAALAALSDLGDAAFNDQRPAVWVEANAAAAAISEADEFDSENAADGGCHE